MREGGGEPAMDEEEEEEGKKMFVNKWEGGEGTQRRAGDGVANC